MVKVDFYSFGEIVIEGKSYTRDVIIFPDRVMSDWWRKEGHQVCIDDLQEVFKDKPKTLIIGTGSYGVVKVLPETKERLRAEGIKLVAEKTDEAVRKFNQLSETEKVVAGLHLTC